MIITEELVAQWLDNPVTRRYRAAVQEYIAQECNLELVSESQSIEDIGAETLARMNYVAGLRDSQDVDHLLRMEVEDD